jgi:integrase
MIMGINEILEDCQNYMDTKATLSIVSKRKYIQIIRLFLLDCGMRFNLETINRYLFEKNKNKNINNSRYALKYLLYTVGKFDWANKILKTKLKPRKKKFHFVPMKKMQDVINHLPSKFRKVAFIQIKTGGRFREIATLRAEDIDYSVHDKLIYIYIGEGAKRKKERKLRLSKKYESYLRKWTPRPKGYLFLPQEWESLSEEQLITNLENFRQYYNTELARVGNMIGIENLSSHYLRHLFSDYFLHANPDNVYALKTILGHKKIETTERYVSLGDPIADRALINMEEG